MAESEWVSCEVAAVALGLGVKTIQRRVKAGEIRGREAWYGKRLTYQVHASALPEGFLATLGTRGTLETVGAAVEPVETLPTLTPERALAEARRALAEVMATVETRATELGALSGRLAAVTEDRELKQAQLQQQQGRLLELERENERLAGEVARLKAQRWRWPWERRNE
jgi:hypothetical protein